MASAVRALCLTFVLTTALSIAGARAPSAPQVVPVWLPIQPPARVYVTQGNDCTLKWCDHRGLYRYAWDFIVGTSNFVITAAHGGTVEAIDDNSHVICDKLNHQKGAPPTLGLAKCWAYANFILIADDQNPSDGAPTATLYMHLQPGSLQPQLSYGGQPLAPGDHVDAGDPLALAGTTGYSTGVHLHFQVEQLPAIIGTDPYTGWWFTPTVPAVFLDPEVLVQRPDGIPLMGDTIPLHLLAPTPTATATPLPTATPIPTPTPIGSGGAGSCTTTTGLLASGACLVVYARTRRRRRGPTATPDTSTGWSPPSGG